MWLWIHSPCVAQSSEAWPVSLPPILLYPHKAQLALGIPHPVPPSYQGKSPSPEPQVSHIYQQILLLTNMFNLCYSSIAQHYTVWFVTLNTHPCPNPIQAPRKCFSKSFVLGLLKQEASAPTKVFLVVPLPTVEMDTASEQLVVEVLS